MGVAARRSTTLGLTMKASGTAGSAMVQAFIISQTDHATKGIGRTVFMTAWAFGTVEMAALQSARRIKLANLCRGRCCQLDENPFCQWYCSLPRNIRFLSNKVARTCITQQFSRT